MIYFVVFIIIIRENTNAYLIKSEICFRDVKKKNPLEICTVQHHEPPPDKSGG